MKSLKSWYLYDFANSFASSVVIFYFPLVLAERGYSDNYVGMGAALATLFLVILYPFLGRKSDFVLGLRMRYMRISSILMALTLVVMAYLNSSSTSLLFLFIMIMCFVLFQVAFQGSYVFYTAQMKELEDNGFNKKKLSSIGMGFGQLGNAVAVGIAGYLVSKNLFFLGTSGKGLVFFFGAISFAFLSLPYLLQKSSPTANMAIQGGVVSIKEAIRILILKFRQSKKLLFFGVGYMLIADSVFTMQTYVSLYLKKVFLFSDSQISAVLMVSLLSLVLTCFIGGRLAHKIKVERKFLIISAFIYFISFISLALIPSNFYSPFVSFAFIGIAYGLFFPFARTYYSNLIPSEQQAEFFSVFVVFERAASILGPLLFIAVLNIFSTVNVAVGYRAAILSLSCITIIGLFFIKQHHKYV